MNKKKLFIGFSVFVLLLFVLINIFYRLRKKYEYSINYYPNHHPMISYKKAHHGNVIYRPKSSNDELLKLIQNETVNTEEKKNG